MFFRLLSCVMRRRRIVLWVTLACFAVSLVVVLASGPIYECGVLLLPPAEEGSEGLLATWMAQLNLPSMMLPMASGTAKAAILADILESRRLAEIVIESHRLREVYDVSTMDEAIGRLNSRTTISVTPFGMIKLAVRDDDAARAAAIASSYISGLDSLNRLLLFSRANATTDFIAEQISKYDRKLDRLRDEVALFQREHGIIDMEEQVKGAVDVAAELKVRAALAGIERDLLGEFARDDAVELRRKEAEYEALTRRLTAIVEGDSSDAVFFPLGDMPVLFQRYAALQRDLEVNERVYSFLLQRFEEAGIEKARTTPSVQVVDEPRVPERSAGLPWWAVALISAAVGCIWITALIACLGWLEYREKNPAEEASYRQVRELAREDLRRLRRLLRI